MNSSWKVGDESNGKGVGAGNSKISIGLHQARVNFNMFSVKSFTSIISFDFHNNSVK